MKPTDHQQSYLRGRRRHKRLVALMRILIFVSFFVLWEISTRAGWIDSFIFSSPTRIWSCFAGMGADGSMALHIGVTLFETFVSFVLVVAISILVTILLWMSSSVSETAEPYLVILNSLPKSALAPLLIVWLGANYKTIIVTGMSVAIFGSILSLFHGFLEVDKDYIKLIRTLGGTKKDILFKVILPANLPNLLSIMKVDVGLCLVGVIIGEFIAARQGLGYLIIYGSQIFRLDWVIMSIVILCVIAMGLYALISLLERRCGKRY